MFIVIKLIKCFYQSIVDMIDHGGVEHAGYLSFLSMVAIFPFLFFFMALIGTFGDEVLSNKLVEIILASSWAGLIDALKPRIIELTASPPQGLLTIAVIGAVWTASSIFEGLRTILNRAYRVTSAPPYIWRRLLSIGEFFVTITITVLSVVALVLVPYLIDLYQKIISSHLPDNLAAFVTPEAEEIRFIILILIILFAVAFGYYSLPNRKQRFLKTMPGALVVLIGWITFTSIFKYYVKNFPQVNVIYGSIAGVIIALLYFYFCSMILIIGAEFNYLLEINFKNKNKR
jgi:membrane protein